MGIILKLECGRDTLDINSGRYCIEDSDFAPPTTARAVTYGSLVAGADAIAKRRENREWSFTINITAAGNASISEAERALRNLQTFLNRAGVHDPLYVAYRSFDDYSYEPYFGQFGAFSRYEVVHASAQAQGNYSRPLIGSNVIYGVRVTLVIKPQALGKWQASGQAIGGVFEDYIGKADSMARGTVIANNGNEFTNPVFSASTYDDGWTLSGTGAEKAQNTNPEYVLFGNSSIRISTVATLATLSQTYSPLLGTVYYISAYVKMDDESDPEDAGIVVYGPGSLSGSVSYQYLGDGWWRVYAAYESDTSLPDTYGVQHSGTGVMIPFYVGAMQLTVTRHYPIVYGDMLGVDWNSTKGTSVTNATTGRLRYNFTDFLNQRDHYTIRVVWMPDAGSSGSRYFLEDSSDGIGLLLNSSNQIVARSKASDSVTSSAITVTPGTPIVIHYTFGAGTITIYANGSSVGTSGSNEGVAATPTYMYIGSDDTPANHCLGTLMGVATFDRPMTAAEVLADYTQIRYQADDGDRIDPLPWVFTEDGDNIVDNDNDGTRYCYAVVGGLMGDDVETALKLDSSNTFILGPGVTMGSLPVPQYLFDKDILTDGGTNTLLFENGTGTSDTTANGDAVKRISLSTSVATLLETAISLRAADILRVADNVTGYFVAKDAATLTNVQVRMSVDFGGANESFVSDWRTLATSNSFRPYVTFELPLNFEEYILDSSRVMGFKIQVRRTAGASTQNFDVSHAIWLLNYAGVYTADVTASPDLDMAYMRGRVLELVDDSAATRTRGRRILNRPLLIRPERLNVLMLQHTFDNYAASKTTWTTAYSLEIEQFGTRPRWDIY